MSSSHVFRFCAAVFAFGVSAAVASAQIAPPEVPANLLVPGGHSVFLVGHATGTQNYICLPGDQPVAWRFLAPQATLFEPSESGTGPQITTHFLSPNPVEGNLARPTWQHSIDTSRVWGRAAASSTDPTFVAPGSIPWLLLEIVGVGYGTAGGSGLAATTFIQRVHTRGGLPPAEGCAKPRDVGGFVMVPYETDYYFYRADAPEE